MSSLERQAPCPSCGATVSFPLGGARAIVCEYCRFVVARSDRGLVASGRMADLLELPTAFAMDRTGSWGGQSFVVQGRIQLDRVGQASAPWEEVLLAFPSQDTTTWVAHAQGRWYATSEVPFVAEQLPPFNGLTAGQTIDLGEHGAWVVQEVGQRKVVSGEGAMTMVPAPDVATGYVDINAAGGRFGTIDYGDGASAPELYLGKQFQPAEVTFEDGMPLEMPTAAVTAVECPSCGGNLPLVNQAAERIVCPYCATASDMRQGQLSALGPAPKPPIAPAIALGTSGQLRGHHYVVAGFVMRSCYVEGENYGWREYLLYGGDNVGYRWLMEEDGRWTFVEPVDAAEVQDTGGAAVFRGNNYRHSQTVQATVNYVLGEFYWKVEIGETVDATEWEGPGGKVSRERTPSEVNFSFVSPLARGELRDFGIVPPPKKRSAASWVAVGCGLLVVVPALCVAGLVVFGASQLEDFSDVIDGDVELAAAETAAIKAMLEEAQIDPKSVNVDTSNDSTCDTCTGVIIENGHVTAVHLDGKGLRSVTTLAALTELRALRVKNNKITSAEGLGALTKVHTVDLSSNQLKSLGDMSGCTALSKLDLRDNQLTSVEGLQGMPALSELQLLNNPISSLEGMADLPKLSALTLDKAQLKSFEGLGSMPALRTLDVRNAGLTSLAGLEGATALESLTVTNNRLTSLKELAPLPKLRTIYATNNRIDSLAGLSTQPALTQLNLSYNKLTSVSDEQGSTTLTTLDVSHNPITEVKDPAPLPRLTLLRMNNSQLVALGAAASLGTLTRLEVASNKLTELKGIDSLKGLTALDVSGNQLTTLHEVSSMSQLADVDAHNNKLDKDGTKAFLANPPQHYNLAGNLALVGLALKVGRYLPPPPVVRPTRSPVSRYRSGGGPSLGK